MSEPIESARFHEVGWRVLAYTEATHFRTRSLAEGAALAEAICEVARTTSRQPDMDLRSKGVTVRLQRDESGELTEADLALAGAISTRRANLAQPSTSPACRATKSRSTRSSLPTCCPSGRPVLGYERFGDALIDPHFEGPTFWFQQMDAPRPQRNRIHIDLYVPEDQARPASTRRSPRVAASSTRTARRCGGPSPIPRATRWTSLPGRIWTETSSTSGAYTRPSWRACSPSSSDTGPHSSQMLAVGTESSRLRRVPSLAAYPGMVRRDRNGRPPGSAALHGCSASLSVSTGRWRQGRVIRSWSLACGSGWSRCTGGRCSTTSGTRSPRSMAGRVRRASRDA